MSDLKVYLLWLIGFALTSYLGMSYINLDLNMFKWVENSRILFTVLTLLVNPVFGFVCVFVRVIRR